MSSSKITNRLLWTAQILVALLFLFAGSMKFIMPAAKMQEGPIALPITLLHFIGICECLGALGLVLPGALRTKTWLTPVAAAGLTIIMIGATVITIATMSVAAAIVPAVVGVLTVTIARGRRSEVALAHAGRRAPRQAQRRVLRAA